MPTLHITRGLPGCGKTTWADQQVAKLGWVRVNRDDTRAQFRFPPRGSHLQEKLVTDATHHTISTALRAGWNVVCDDTNLPARTVRTLRTLAAASGAGFQIHDMTDVPLTVCIDRDRARGDAGGRSVGEQVIRGMHARYLAGRPYPLQVPDDRAEDDLLHQVQRYTPPGGAPRAILVDVDGTVALMNGRDPYDETCVDEDLPNEPVIEVVQALHAAGYRSRPHPRGSSTCSTRTSRRSTTPNPTWADWTVQPL